MCFCTFQSLSYSNLACLLTNTTSNPLSIHLFRYVYSKKMLSYIFLKIHEDYYVIDVIQFPSVYPKQHCSEHSCTFSCVPLQVFWVFQFILKMRLLYIYIYTLITSLSNHQIVLQNFFTSFHCTWMKVPIATILAST